MGNGFNEAAGIHRRKRRICLDGTEWRKWRFNEAAGIHRRKRTTGAWRSPQLELHDASMRPPEFTGGNLEYRLPVVLSASAV